MPVCVCACVRAGSCTARTHLCCTAMLCGQGRVAEVLQRRHRARTLCPLHCTTNRTARARAAVRAKRYGVSAGLPTARPCRPFVHRPSHRAAALIRIGQRSAVCGARIGAHPRDVTWGCSSARAMRDTIRAGDIWVVKERMRGRSLLGGPCCTAFDAPLTQVGFKPFPSRQSPVSLAQLATQTHTAHTAAAWSHLRGGGGSPMPGGNARRAG